MGGLPRKLIATLTLELKIWRNADK